MSEHIVRSWMLPLLLLAAVRLPVAAQTIPQDQTKDHAAMGHAPTSAATPQHDREAKGTTPAGEVPQAASKTPGRVSTDARQQSMDHPSMDHGAMQQGDSKAAPMDVPAAGHAGMAHDGMKMDSMGPMTMGPMQGGKAPPDARDPAAYNEGAQAANLPGNEMADMARFGRIMFSKVEGVSGDGEHGQNVESEAWYGGDYNKAWLKADGERRNGRLEALRTEVMWDRTFSPFWSTQLGVRHDTGAGDSRSWLAAGVRGLAPYWFDVDATAYWRAGGEVAARVAVAYELLFTQRLILEPELEANLYSRMDKARGIGSGLSDVEFGLRLRYEIRRQFAPYIGVTWNRKYGSTADLARLNGADRKTVQAVAGVRIWF